MTFFGVRGRTTPGAFVPKLGTPRRRYHCCIAGSEGRITAFGSGLGVGVVVLITVVGGGILLALAP